jgi:hypothetical protein
MSCLAMNPSQALRQTLLPPDEYLGRQKALQLEIINAGQAHLNILQQQIIEALNKSGIDSEA